MSTASRSLSFANVLGKLPREWGGSCSRLAVQCSAAALPLAPSEPHRSHTHGHPGARRLDTGTTAAEATPAPAPAAPAAATPAPKSFEPQHAASQSAGMPEEFDDEDSINAAWSESSREDNEFSMLAKMLAGDQR